MANVHGLYSNKKDDSDDEKDESNNRYVGGIGDHGGGRWVSFVCLWLDEPNMGFSCSMESGQPPSERNDAGVVQRIKTGWSGVVLVLIKLVAEQNKMQQTGLPREAGSCLDAGGDPA